MSRANPISTMRRHYGAHPLQLLALLATFALSGYAFYRASMGPLPVRMLIWFVAAIVGHDLVLYPLYALADRSWHLVSRRTRVRRRSSGQDPAVPAVNYLRVPVVVSGFLLIAFWGTITGQGDGHFFYASDHHFASFLARWLVITGIFFAVSAVLYAWRLGRVRTTEPPERRPSPHDSQGQVIT
ncbi:MAG TPA: hypothetical protein VIJ71_09600 [Mycobacteriales bacterium]